MATGSYDAIIQLGVDATKALSDLTRQLQATSTTLEKSLQTSAKAGGKSLKEETSKGVKNGMKEGATKGAGFFTSITHQLKNRIQLTIAQGLVDAYRNAFKDIITNVKELNDAQTEFKKVSQLNGQALDVYTDKAANIGRTVGKSATEIVEAATEFRKSSFGDTESLKLAKLATIYQSVADEELSAAEAASFMISQLKAGFSDVQDGAKGAEYAIDAINEVSNNFAVSSGDLANNIGKTSAAMAAGNVTYAQTLGLMTGMTEVTRNAATSATALNRIQSRFNQVLDESSSVGKKLLAWYAKYDIDVFDKQTGQIRSFYDVLGDVADKWDDMTENEQKYYLLTQASATQTNRLSALLSNYNTVVNATATAEESAGSASTEFAKVQESLQYALRDLNSAWEKLSQDLIKSGTLTKIINAVTKIVDLLDKMVNTVGGLPTMFMAVATSIGLVGAALKSIELPGILLGKGLSKLGVGGAVSTATPTVAGVGAEVVAGASLGTSLKEAFKAIGYSADPAELAKKGLDNLNDSERRVILNSTKLKRAKEAEALAQDKLTTAYKELYGANYDLQNLKEAGRKIDLDGMTNAEKLRHLQGNANKENLSGYKKLSSAQSKVAQATNEMSMATQNAVEAEKALQVSQAEATIAANQLLPVLQTLGATLLLVGLAVGLKALGDSMSYKNTIKELKEVNSEYKTMHTRRAELLRLGSRRTSDEEYELAVIEHKLELLKEEIKAKKKLIALEFNREAKNVLGGGVAGDSSKDYATLIASRNNNIATLRQQRQEAIDNGDVTAAESYNRQIEETIALIDKETQEITDLYGTIKGIDYNDLDEDGKAYFKQIVSGYLSVIDNAKQFKKALKLLPEDETITLTFQDSDGNYITGSYSVGELLNLDTTEFNLLFSASKTGDWSEIETYLNENNITDGYLYNLWFHFNSEGKEDVENDKKEASEDATATVTIDANDKPVQKSWDIWEGRQTNATVNIDGSPTERLKKWWNRWKDLNSSQTSKAADALSATGKRKGEQGGLSWLGDEGSAQNPKPELVVGENGAYLAGTSGWELYNLKSSDIVYTATQTKKLLANNSFKGSVGELPRYAKGKNTWNGRAISAKSAKAKRKKLREAYDKDLETLEYNRDLYSQTDSEFKAAYKELYQQYKKKLNKLIINGKKQGLGTDRYRAYMLAMDETKEDKTQENVEGLLGAVSHTGQTVKAEAAITEGVSNGDISIDEAKDYMKTLYKNNYEYYKKQYEEGRITYEELTKEADKYYDVVGRESEEYYETQEELDEFRKEAAKKRLEEAQEDYLNGKITYEELQTIAKDYWAFLGAESDEYYDSQKELEEAHRERMLDTFDQVSSQFAKGRVSWEELKKAAQDYFDTVEKGSKEYKEVLEEMRDLAVQDNEQHLDYAQQYVDYQIDILQKKKEEAEETERMAELEQDIVDAENELAKANSTMVRTFKDGKWIYAVDPEAVAEAEKSLADAKKALADEEGTELDRQIAEWEAVQETLNQAKTEYDLRSAGALVGDSFMGTIAGLGTNVTAWGNLAQGYYNDSFAINQADGDALKQLLWAHGFNISSIDANSASSSGTSNASTNNAIWSAMASNSIIQQAHQVAAEVIETVADGASQIFNFDNLTLPNVTDANSFIKELSNLPNRALQSIFYR